MNAREIITLVIILGGFVLAALGKIDVTALMALVAGAALPSPVVRDYSA